MAQLVEHALPRLPGIDTQVAERYGGELPARIAFGDAQQAEQYVLGADVVVTQRTRLPE